MPGLGPIVRDGALSRKLYADDLAIAFKEETGGYLHTEALKGVDFRTLATAAGGPYCCTSRLISSLSHCYGASVATPMRLAGALCREWR